MKKSKEPTQCDGCRIEGVKLHKVWISPTITKFLCRSCHRTAQKIDFGWQHHKFIHFR